MTCRFLRRAALAFALVIVPLAAAAAEEVTLAAVAGFRRPIAELAAAFEAASGHKVLQIYGHMGQVVAQARESGRVAIVCGDRAGLEAAKDLAFDRFVPLGSAQLVVAYRKGLHLAKPEEIAGDAVKRIGVPDQANAIYGKSARQYLERAHLAAAVDPKLVPVAMVPQVTSYVAAGELDAGFVNATDAIGAGTDIGGFVAVDPALYDPVEVSCGVLSAAKNAAADGFAQFLESAQAKAILARYGL